MTDESANNAPTPRRRVAVVLFSIVVALAGTTLAILMSTGSDSDDTAPVDPTIAVDTPSDPLAAGIQAANRGDTDTARELLNKSIEDNPSAIAIYSLALIEDRANNRDEALRLYNESLNLDPKFVPALLNRAQLLLVINAEDGLDAFAAALADNPQDVTIATSYARALIDTNNTEEGINLLRDTLLTLAPEEAQGILNTYPQEIIDQVTPIAQEGSDES